MADAQSGRVLRWLLSDKMDYATTSLADGFFNGWFTVSISTPVVATLFPISFHSSLTFPNVTPAQNFTHYLTNWAHNYAIYQVVTCCRSRPQRLNSHTTGSLNKGKREHQEPPSTCVCVFQRASLHGDIPAKSQLPPAEQWHLNPPDRSSQVEPCWQRSATQWFMGVWQRGPACPCWHTHL